MSWLPRRWVVLVGFLAAAAADQPAVAWVVTTDARARFQTIDGWGAAASGYERHEASEKDNYKQAFRDAGFNILRISIEKEVLHSGGNTNCPGFPAEDENLHERVELAVGSLAADVAKFDFTNGRIDDFGELANWLQGNTIEPERFRVTGSLWTPPHWMKGQTGIAQGCQVSGCSGTYCTPFLSGDLGVGSAGPCKGETIGGRLFLDRDCTGMDAPRDCCTGAGSGTCSEEFGRYIAAWVTGWETPGSHHGPDGPFPGLSAISLQNELHFENKFDSATYDRGPGVCIAPGDPGNVSGPVDQHDQYAIALESVRAEFAAEGITVPVMGPHMDSLVKTGGIANPTRLDDQMDFIDAVKAVTSPTNLIDFISIYNSNAYCGGFCDEPDLAKSWAGYLNGKDQGGGWDPSANVPGVKDDGKKLYVSETSSEDHAWTIDDGAITVAEKIFAAIVHGEVSAYVYWRLADDGVADDNNLVGGTDIANGTPENSKKYNAFKHFSRYVRPGAVRISANFSNGKASIGGADEWDIHDSVNVSAFVHQDDLRITWVLINMRPTLESIDIRMPSTLYVDPLDHFSTDATDDFAYKGSLSPSGGSVSIAMPAASITTLTGTFVPAAVPLRGVELLALSLLISGWALLLRRAMRRSAAPN